jgi:hypothetical protein
MLTRLSRIAITLAMILAPASVLAADQPPPKPKAEPPGGNQFGINQAGITSPEVRDAITRMNEAGIVEGRKGSLTFFRWATDAKPPLLAHLGLWGPKVTNDVFALVAALPDLEHVSVYETNIDDKGLAALTRLKKLRTFSVLPITRYEKAGFGPPQWSYPFMAQRADRPRITGKVLSELAPIKTLENLDLLDARIASSDLAGLSAWPKLSSLSLPNAIDAETVKHLRACPKLATLTLGYREITAAELEVLAGWKALRKFTVVHAKLSDEALQAFSKLGTLEELSLMDCDLKDDRLRHLRGSAKLSYLALQRNEIDGTGIEHLAKLKLKTLGLEFNNISDKTLPHLSQLTTVENLALSYCRGVTDEGIRSGTLQKMTNLKQLGLRGTKLVTDASLDDLVKFGHLEHITIRETKISPDGVEKMKAAMPKTVVFK